MEEREGEEVRDIRRGVEGKGRGVDSDRGWAATHFYLVSVHSGDWGS